MISQNKQVLHHLMNHTGITSKEAFENYGITRLSARISDLRERGYEISDVWREGLTRLDHKCRFVEYRLKKI